MLNLLLENNNYVIKITNTYNVAYNNIFPVSKLCYSLFNT